ncbi:MAG TPA: cytochrome ubiquinol oxidase subunit I [Actinomycetota bacterium]|nr:cytochrome ubiquinol oxidase subunit I [Actinomycetota bacterium]
MDAFELSRWQFAITTIFHFFFVPLSIGLAFITAIVETAWVRTKDPEYLRMTKFWGKLFLINFALGVVTGIVQEFQFGMNWSAYSRFVGDIFGAPLAIEGLAAFFLESTFIGLWIFGWTRLSPRLHAATMWVVAFGTLISAFFILAANAWMQHPVGYELNPETGRAELNDFFALMTNITAWSHFGHTILAALATGGMFVIGVSAWHLRRRPDSPVFRRSMTVALIVSLFASLGVAFSGHFQAQLVAEQQPMKTASAEALWDDERGAGFSLFAVGDVENGRNHINLQLPHMLSVLTTNTWNGEVRGINDIQAEYEQRFGPGSYIPVVGVIYWTFRLMVGAGMLMILVSVLGLWYVRRGTLARASWFLRLAPFAIALPYLANSTGWIMTEMGRQPWVVFGVMLTRDAGSTSVGVGLVLTTLIGFTVIYGLLTVIDVYLLSKYARSEPTPVTEPSAEPALVY